MGRCARCAHPVKLWQTMSSIFAEDSLRAQRWPLADRPATPPPRGFSTSNLSGCRARARKASESNLGGGASPDLLNGKKRCVILMWIYITSAQAVHAPSVESMFVQSGPSQQLVEAENRAIEACDCSPRTMTCCVKRLPCTFPVRKGSTLLEFDHTTSHNAIEASRQKNANRAAMTISDSRRLRPQAFCPLSSQPCRLRAINFLRGLHHRSHRAHLSRDERAMSPAPSLQHTCTSMYLTTIQWLAPHPTCKDRAKSC